MWADAESAKTISQLAELSVFSRLTADLTYPLVYPCAYPLAGWRSQYAAQRSISSRRVVSRTQIEKLANRIEALAATQWQSASTSMSCTSTTMMRPMMSFLQTWLQRTSRVLQGAAAGGPAGRRRLALALSFDNIQKQPDAS